MKLGTRFHTELAEVGFGARAEDVFAARRLPRLPRVPSSVNAFASWKKASEPPKSRKLLASENDETGSVRTRPHTAATRAWTGTEMRGLSELLSDARLDMLLEGRMR